MAKYVKQRDLLYRQLYYFIASGHMNIQQAAEALFREFGIPLKTGDWIEDLKGHIPPEEYTFLLTAAKTGKLEEALKNLQDHTAKMEKTKKTFISKLTFPAIELVFGIALFLFIIAYVAPRFATLIEGIGGELPAISKAVFSVGRFMLDYLIVWLSGVVIFGIWAAKNWTAILDRLPIARKISLLYEKTIFFLSMSFYYSSGFNVVSSIEQIELNLRFLDLAAVKERLSRGYTLTQSLSGLLTPSEERFIDTGEKTGKLDDVFPLLAESNQEKLFRVLNHLAEAVTPVLLTVLGILVFFVLMAMYLPLVRAAISV